MVRLEDLYDRNTRQLSGGQRQRVSIARALVYQPDVLLLDEPFSNLDAKLRVAMRSELVEIQRRTQVTALFVTHDQEEAMHISDRIVVMNAGRIEQVGSPAEVYRHPKSVFVADFLGEANLLEGRIGAVDGGTALVETAGGLQFKAAIESRWSPGDTCWFMVRPEHMTQLDTQQPRPDNILGGTVKSHAFLGSSHIVHVEVSSYDWTMKFPDSAAVPVAPGDSITVGWDASSSVVLHA